MIGKIQPEKNKYYAYSTIAYYSGYGGIEIKSIEYGINDYIVYVAGAWTCIKSIHRVKIYYDNNGGYFRYKGCKIPLNECIRT